MKIIKKETNILNNYTIYNNLKDFHFMENYIRLLH